MPIRVTYPSEDEDEDEYEYDVDDSESYESSMPILRAEPIKRLYPKLLRPSVDYQEIAGVKEINPGRRIISELEDPGSSSEETSEDDNSSSEESIEAIPTSYKLENPSEEEGKRLRLMHEKSALEHLAKALTLRDAF